MKTDHPNDSFGMGRAVFPYVLIAVALAHTTCGKQSNPEFCADSLSCSNPKMFCDSLGESGSLQNECVFRPSCEQGCLSLVPICDVEENLCRSCTPGTEGDAECIAVAATTPLCSERGSCIACTTPTDCRDNAAPDCAIDGSCQPCRPGDSGNTMCSERDAAVPHCLDGTCVTCLQKSAIVDSDCTDETKPICDAYACRGCQNHEECSRNGVPGVCTRSTGACLPKDAVVFVDANTKTTDNGPCGEDPGDLACATISKALRLVAADDSTKTAIRVAAGTYPETLEIATDVLILGEDGVVIDPPETNTEPVLRVTDESHLVLDTVRVKTGKNYDGISCVDASISLLQTELTGITRRTNFHSGLDATNCTVQIVGESIIANYGDTGIDINGGTLTVRKSTITNNRNGISIQNSVVAVQDSAVTNNSTGIGIGSGTLTVQNSAVSGDNGPGFHSGIIVIGGIATVQDSTITNNFPEEEDSIVHNFTGIHIRLGGAITVDNTVVANTKVGIRASQGVTLTLRNSMVINNEAQGLAIGDADFSVVNNFFSGNGHGGSTLRRFPAVSIRNNEEKTVQNFAFNTVYNNGADSADPPTTSGVSCMTTKRMVAQNNIVFGNLNAPNVTLPSTENSCRWEYSNIGGDTMYPGTGNVNSPPALDADTYKLTTNSACCIDTGAPDAMVGEDFEKQKRPHGDGYDIGADEFVP